MIGPEGEIVFGAEDNHLYVLESNGQLRWKLPFNGSLRHAAAIDQLGNIYFGDNSGTF